jgi:hypothetical protein
VYKYLNPTFVYKYQNPTFVYKYQMIYWLTLVNEWKPNMRRLSIMMNEHGQNLMSSNG